MRYRQRPVAMPTVVRGALLLLLFTCTFSRRTSGTCHKATVFYTARDTKRGCLPKTIASVGCRGTCFSYARVSPRHYGLVERSCQCCQEVGYRTVKVRFNCPRRVPRYHFADVRLALDCRCRPCDSLSGANVPGELHLTDYTP